MTIFLPEERDIVDAEMRVLRAAFPRRRPSFPLLPYQSGLARRLSRRGSVVSRADVAFLLLQWSRERGDTRLIVYQPLVAVSRSGLPDELSHVERVVRRHPDFERWIIDAVK